MAAPSLAIIGGFPRYYLSYWSNVHITHGGRVHDNIRNTEKISTTDSRQLGSIEESLRQLKLVDGEVDVVTIRELVEGGGDTAALLNPERGGGGGGK